MRRPRWLPALGTLGQIVAILVAVATLAGLRGARHAVADTARWLAHPVDTPRVVFVLLLALAGVAGVMLLVALGRRLFGTRDTPRKRAEDFRSTWEKLADDLRLWLSWQATNDNALKAPQLHELYRDNRRAVLVAYARVQYDFRPFLEENVAWDLREPLPIELDPSDVFQEGIDGPFQRLWELDNLPAVIHWVGRMTPEEFSEWIGRRSDVLDAFVSWMSDR
jgi:hypothetical protein